MLGVAAAGAVDTGAGARAEGGEGGAGAVVDDAARPVSATVGPPATTGTTGTTTGRAKTVQTVTAAFTLPLAKVLADPLQRWPDGHAPSPVQTRPQNGASPINATSGALHPGGLIGFELAAAVSGENDSGLTQPITFR